VFVFLDAGTRSSSAFSVAAASPTAEAGYVTPIRLASGVDLDETPAKLQRVLGGRLRTNSVPDETKHHVGGGQQFWKARSSERIRPRAESSGMALPI